MNRIVTVLLAVVLMAANIFVSQPVAKAEEAAYQVPVNEDGIEAVTLEMQSGDIAVVYILREDKDNIYAQNLASSMEASMPRSKILKIRKPTAKEVAKVRARWNTAPQDAPSATEKK